MNASTADISFEREPNYLVVRAHTRYILVEKEAACRTIAAAIADRPIRAALVDLREVPGPYTFMDRFGLGEAAGRYLAGTPIAALLTEEQTDPGRIGELTARNRGANVTVFVDSVEAQAWMRPYLTSEP